MESDRNPVLTQDGRLAFISQRNEQPFVSDRDDETLISTLNSDGLYAAPREAVSQSGHDAAGRATKIDLQGPMARAVALPVTPAVITSLTSVGSRLFYQTKPPQLIDGDLAGGRSALHVLDLTTSKDRVVVEGLSTTTLSADGAKVAYRRDGAWWMALTIDAASAVKVDLAGPADQGRSAP